MLCAFLLPFLSLFAATSGGFFSPIYLLCVCLLLCCFIVLLSLVGFVPKLLVVAELQWSLSAGIPLAFIFRAQKMSAGQKMSVDYVQHLITFSVPADFVEERDVCCTLLL